MASIRQHFSPRRLGAIALDRHIRGSSSNDQANARWAATANIPAQRWLAAVARSRTGAARAFEAAKRRRKSASSAPKRPPTSTARTKVVSTATWAPAIAVAHWRGPQCGGSPPAGHRCSCHAARQIPAAARSGAPCGPRTPATGQAARWSPFIQSTAAAAMPGHVRQREP